MTVRKQPAVHWAPRPRVGDPVSRRRTDGAASTPRSPNPASCAQPPGRRPGTELSTPARTRTQGELHSWFPTRSHGQWRTCPTSGSLGWASHSTRSAEPVAATWPLPVTCRSVPSTTRASRAPPDELGGVPGTRPRPGTLCGEPLPTARRGTTSPPEAHQVEQELIVGTVADQPGRRRDAPTGAAASPLKAIPRSASPSRAKSSSSTPGHVVTDRLSRACVPVADSKRSGRRLGPTGLVSPAGCRAPTSRPRPRRHRPNTAGRVATWRMPVVALIRPASRRARRTQHQRGHQGQLPPTPADAPRRRGTPRPRGSTSPPPLPHASAGLEWLRQTPQHRPRPPASTRR